MNNNSQTYDDLILELRDNRKELIRSVLPKIVSFRTKLDLLLPTDNDYKNRFVLEQKMKAITEILGTELSIRKQIDDSVKNEFELLRKSRGEDISEISIAKLAEAIEFSNRNNPDIASIAQDISNSEDF